MGQLVVLDAASDGDDLELKGLYVEALCQGFKQVLEVFMKIRRRKILDIFL